MLFKLLPLRTEKSRLEILVFKRISKHIQFIALLATALSFGSNDVNAQYLYELGFGGGLLGYTGEVSNDPFSNLGYTLGGFYRSNINSRFSMRLGVDYGQVGGSTDDVSATFPQDDGSVLDYDFSTNYISGEFLFEVNFFPYPFQKEIMNSSDITPFLFAGAGVVNFQSEDGIAATASVPFGAGVKWLFSKQWGLQLQFKTVKMFTDRFDGDVLDDPYRSKDSGIHCDDWCFTTTVMLVYSFGEDIWDCHCPGGYKRKRRRR